MARHQHLRIYDLARQNLREVATITQDMAGFGDLVNQMRRAAVSVVSNICEGASSGQDRQFVRYLGIARASVHELQGQLAIASDLGQMDAEHPIHDRCDHLGRSISRLIAHLAGPGS